MERISRSLAFARRATAEQGRRSICGLPSWPFFFWEREEISIDRVVPEVAGSRTQMSSDGIRVLSAAWYAYGTRELSWERQRLGST